MRVFSFLVSRANFRYLTKEARYRYVNSRLEAYLEFINKGRLFD